MTYATGTFANSATPAGSMVTAMKNALGLNTNWSFIETFTDSAGYTHDVYKCGGAGNSAGADFFIGIVKQSNTATQVSIEAFEQYNATTHQYTRPVPWINGSSQVSPTSVGTADETPRTLLANDSTNTRVYPLFQSINLSTTGGTFDYWIIVTVNGLFAMSRVGTTASGKYAGLIDTFVYLPATNDPVPLCVADLTIGQGIFSNGQNFNSYAAMSRASLQGTTARYNPWGIIAPSYSDATTSWTYPANVGISTSVPDLLQNGVPLASRVTAIVDTVNIYGANVVGRVRGLFKDMLRVVMGSGAAQGDTLVINAHTYVAVGNGLWLDTQAV